MDESICTLWLERHLYPQGFTCPHCGSGARRFFRAQGSFPAYRCRACEGYYTLLTGTVFAETRQCPATLVLLLRGIAQGASTAHLARELGVSRKQLHTLRQRIQANMNATAPTDAMIGTAFEADERYQNAGEKTYAPSLSPPAKTAVSPNSSAHTPHISLDTREQQGKWRDHFIMPRGPRECG